jgi:hypothetical protein
LITEFHRPGWQIYAGEIGFLNQSVERSQSSWDKKGRLSREGHLLLFMSKYLSAATILPLGGKVSLELGE